jgi:hypothetical protein
MARAARFLLLSFATKPADFPVESLLSTIGKNAGLITYGNGRIMVKNTESLKNRMAEL